MRDDHDHTARIKGNAHPVECPNPAPTRVCYHAGRQKRGVEAHLLLTLERQANDAVDMHAKVLALGDGSLIFRANGGPLKRLDGHSMYDTLRILAEESAVDLPAHAADFKQWAIRSHATLTAHPDAPVHEFRQARRRRSDHITRWREANAHLMGYALSPTPSDVPAAPARATPSIYQPYAVLAWGRGVIDAPINAAPHDPMVHRRLVFDIEDLLADSPSRSNAELMRRLHAWGDTSRAVLTLDHPFADGARRIHLDLDADSKTAPAVPSALAHPVRCPDEARTRTCYHGVLSIGPRRAHLLLTLEHEDGQVSLHANILLLLRNAHVQRGRASGSQIALSASPATVAGSAIGVLNVARSIEFDAPRDLPKDATLAETLAAPRWVEYPQRPQAGPLSVVEAWRAWYRR